MTGELDRVRGAINSQTFSSEETIKKVLPRGHAIHGYSSAINERVIKILATKHYSDNEPLLGLGVDGSAERALGRALLTYAMREQQGLDFITARQFPETDQAQVVTGRNNSRFDNIVWDGDFMLFQDGEEIVAASHYGGGNGLSPLEVRSPDPLGAIILLADRYQFMNEGVARLPAVSIE